jgi:hypothetical protein
LNADNLWFELPTWNHNYRGLSAINHSGWAIPAEDHRVALTIHGWFHSQHEQAEYVISLFLEAIRLAHDATRAVPINPDEVRTVIIPGTKLFADADRTVVGHPSGGRNVLPDLLTLEPSTWGGQLSVQRSDDGNYPDSEWTWTASRLRLASYAMAQTGGEYLRVLEDLVLPKAPSVPRATDALTLPRALDYLDVVWQLTHDHQKLVRLRRASAVTELGLSAESSEEFQARLTSLADILSSICVPPRGAKRDRPLTLLGSQLAEDLSDNELAAADVLYQVDRLNAIVDMRHGQQHSDSALTRAARSAASLGISTAGGNWSAAWEQVRGVAAEALLAIARHVESLPV